MTEGEGTQGPWRRGGYGLSRLLLLGYGWTVARVGQLVIFGSLLDKRTVELTACPVCFLPASQGLPLVEGAR